MPYPVLTSVGPENHTHVRINEETILVTKTLPGFSNDWELTAVGHGKLGRIKQKKNTIIRSCPLVYRIWESLGSQNMGGWPWSVTGFSILHPSEVPWRFIFPVRLLPQLAFSETNLCLNQTNSGDDNFSVSKTIIVSRVCFSYDCQNLNKVNDRFLETRRWWSFQPRDGSHIHWQTQPKWTGWRGSLKESMPSSRGGTTTRNIMKLLFFFFFFGTRG